MRTAHDASRPNAVEISALLERARRRDTSAIQALFRLHMEGVHRIIYRILGPASDVDDLVQAAFMEAFRSLSSFRGDSLFSTWLARIAVRVTMHSLRSRRPRAVELRDDMQLDGGLPGPERQVAAREGLAALSALLAELRPKRRAAFVLNVLEGYSTEEVAAILNISSAAVKVRVHDARRYIEARVRRDPAMADLLLLKKVESARVNS